MTSVTVAMALSIACGGTDGDASGVELSSAPPPPRHAELTALAEEPSALSAEWPSRGDDDAAPAVPILTATSAPDRSRPATDANQPEAESSTAPTTPVNERPSVPRTTPLSAPEPTREAVAVESETESAAAPAPPSHAAFDDLLERYVDASGGVDYAGMKSQHAKLKVYLETLGRETPNDDWSRDEALAYWINAYNAATLDLVLDNYPLNSITDLDGGNPWDVKRIKLGGESYSLNEIENDVIRPRFGEPRIHFAVNCAAKGCPPLRNEAYVAERLDAQLAEQTREFLNDPTHTRLNGDTLTVTSIFDWYGEDFGEVADYVRRYRSDVPADATVAFSDYDWSLNAQ